MCILPERPRQDSVCGRRHMAVMEQLHTDIGKGLPAYVRAALVFGSYESSVLGDQTSNSISRSERVSDFHVS